MHRLSTIQRQYASHGFRASAYAGSLYSHGGSDESVLRYYESIRQQVAADLANRYGSGLLGQAAKERARRLREETERRRLPCNPIEWPTSENSAT